MVRHRVWPIVIGGAVPVAVVHVQLADVRLLRHTDGMNKPEMSDGVPLQERHERFCGHFVESNNSARAYRLAFVVDPELSTREIFRRANELLGRREITARIEEMRDTAFALSGASMRQIIQDWVDQATTDVNELVSYIRTACRHCHGIGHARQWINEAEYAREVVATGKVPDISGGMGFNEYADPHPRCPECRGRGIGSGFIHDTRHLSPQALKLYAGIKQTKDGVQILMHDQNRARENLARCFGAFKDAVAQPTAPAKPVAVPTPEDAQRAYLQVIQGGK